MLTLTTEALSAAAAMFFGSRPMCFVLMLSANGVCQTLQENVAALFLDGFHTQLYQELTNFTLTYVNLWPL